MERMDALDGLLEGGAQLAWGVPRITAARIAYGPCSTQTVRLPHLQRIQRIVFGYAERVV